MNKYIVAFGIVVVFAIVGIAGYLIYWDKGDVAGAAAVPVEQGRVQKQAQSPDDFDKQFQNSDGTVNRAAAAGYVDKEIVSAEELVKSLAVGSEERAKAERRLNMLKALKQKMADAK